jgi:hypothetical protein
MARKARKGNRRTRRQRAGGLGQTYSFGAPIVPGLGNAAEVIPHSSCMAAARPGMVVPPTTGLGLPGMSMRGGARRRSKRSTRRRRSQRGGAYTTTFEPLTGAAPWAGAGPQVERLACTPNYINPLNAGPHTPITQPPVVQRGGVGRVDSAFYAAPTAGYTNVPSTWVGSTGAPSLLQTPYEARTMNQACLKTGGGRRKRGGKRRGTKRSTKRNTRGRFI